jgi:hypothetical protein
MDASKDMSSDLVSVFSSWSSSPDACLLQLASLHVKSLWNPTLGKHAWILQDYLEYNSVFVQLEMLLKEKARCILRLNVGTIDVNETLATLDALISELVESLSVPNDSLKESRLHNMWKDMEEFTIKGISELTKCNKKPTSEVENTPSKTSVKQCECSNKTLVGSNDNTMNSNHKILTESNLPYSQSEFVKQQPLILSKLLKLETKLNIFLKSASFKLLRQISKDKNKIIINFSTSQNLLENLEENYKIFPTNRIYQSNEKLISGLINYKYRRKRKMSEDAKDAPFINIFDNLLPTVRKNTDMKEKENKKLSMINQLDMALKYNKVVQVKQLMDDDDFLLLSQDDKSKLNLKIRLAKLELYELKQTMEKDRLNKLKLSWEKQGNLSRTIDLNKNEAIEEEKDKKSTK